MSALYVYAILDAESAPAPALCAPGLGGAPLAVQPGAEGLAALVAAWDAAPPDATRRNLLTHTAVLERANAHVDILPVRFGTVAPSAARLIDCIAQNAAPFRRAIRDIAGRVERDVAVSWQAGIAFRDMLNADAALRVLRDRLQTRPASQTQPERAELGRKVDAGLAALRAADAAMIHALLDPLAERVVALPPTDDSMVLNGAFLVRRENEPEFDGALRHLAARQRDRLLVRPGGPMPPYSFATLRADWLGQAA